MRSRLLTRPARRFAPDLTAGGLPPRITPDASTVIPPPTLLDTVAPPDVLIIPDPAPVLTPMDPVLLGYPDGPPPPPPVVPPDPNLVPEPADWSEWQPTGVSVA